MNSMHGQPTLRQADRLRFLPNLITIFRILFTPLIGWALALRDTRAAFGLLFVAGFSDALDGYLARRFRWQSELGAKLDPIADKVLTATVFVGLGLAGALPWWLIWLVLGRDLMILALAAIGLHLKGIRQFPPTAWGKFSTFFQLSLAGWTVMDLAWPHVLPGWFLAAFLWLAVCSTVWSGLDYAYRGWKAFRSSQN